MIDPVIRLLRREIKLLRKYRAFLFQKIQMFERRGLRTTATYRARNRAYAQRWYNKPGNKERQAVSAKRWREKKKSDHAYQQVLWLRRKKWRRRHRLTLAAKARASREATRFINVISALKQIQNHDRSTKVRPK